MTEHLTKRYGRRTALQDVNLAVDKGEVFGFLGPNGAGKTTTMRLVLGLIRPSSGRARVAGFDCWSQHLQAAAHFGAVLESPGFYGYLSARQNLAQFARVLGGVPRRRLSELLWLVGLEGPADDRVRTYSLGMRQRLAIAQALLGKPRLLILDEPTNGLDAAGIYEIRQLIRRLSSEQRMAVFLSSHLLGEVQEVCQRVAVLNHGMVRAQGAVAELTRTEGHRLNVTVTDPDRARGALSGVAGLVIKAGNAHGELLLSSADDLAQEVQRRLVLSGVGVTELRPQSLGLEEFFLTLTDNAGAGRSPGHDQEVSWRA